MKRLNGAGTRALQTVREFTVAQRTIAIIGLAAVVLGAIALGNWLTQPSYQPLYTGLSAADASGVVAQLEKDKVPYQLDGTGTILVPAADVSQERLAAAAAGLPSNSQGGYALLDKLGVTASDFQQNITYKRAIEGELATTIESMQGISGASVKLAIPQQTVFTDQQQDPTAAVYLNVTTPLTSQQVQAITHLVAASVPSLTDSNVTVTDQKGDLLASVGGGTGGGSETASAYEAATEASVQAMLDRVLGPGNATVTVAADVSSSSGTTTKESYSVPSSAPVINESTNDSTYTGSNAASGASGVLGTDTTDTSTTTGGTGAGNTYKQTQGSKLNAVDKETTTQSIVPGTLVRQSVAVAVNSSVATKVSAGTLTSLVTAAAGINTARGDQIFLTNQAAFSNASATAAKAALAQQAQAQSADQMSKMITAAIYVVGGIAGMILLFVLLKKLFKRPEGASIDGGVVNVLPMSPSGDPNVALHHAVGAGGMPGALGYGSSPQGLPPTQVLAQHELGGAGFSQLQADVDALAGADPERTAEYLRALMADGARV